MIGNTCTLPKHICNPRKEKVTEPMREQMKRFLAAAATCCMLSGILTAPVAGAPVSAAGLTSVSAEAVYAAGTQYTDSASFAEKVQNIIAGNCGVYADYALTTPVSLPVGSALNTWQTYFVNAGGGGAKPQTAGEIMNALIRGEK